MNVKPTIDERRRLVAQSLQVGNPVNNGRELSGHADVRQECQLELSLEDIQPYEHNPRRSTNPQFDDIKESIRTGGLRVPLTVTRRPGDEHYIVEAGGNTRLAALRQLWAETKDPRYARLTVLYRPWRSESHVLTAHLIENEQRGEMSFWDKATGIVALKARLEAEQSKALSLRPLEDALHALGLSVTTATLALYLFATERLSILGEGMPRLSGLDVKTLQPRLNALKRHALARTSLDEDALYAQVFDPVFRRLVGGRSVEGGVRVAKVIEACEEALAVRLKVPAQVLRSTVDDPDRVQATNVPDRPADFTDAVGVATAPVDTPWSPFQALARSAGIETYIEENRVHPAGVRLLRPDDLITQDPCRRRAWWWLAALSGGHEEQLQQQTPSARDLLDWLVDPADPSAQAALALLIDRRKAATPKRVAVDEEGV